MKICLTGATGFIGQNLLKKWEGQNDLEVIALSRKIAPEMDNAKKGNITWRRCNGFSLLDVEKAVAGADVLIYLIHSMMPSSTLSQGTFLEFDLLLADNFARAAHQGGIKKIIYLSGIIPTGTDLSPHLTSRLEVERALRQYQNQLIVLRAGLIVGKNGSSFKILERLIQRLPILICPAWTHTKTQPIDVKDVVESIDYCCHLQTTKSRIFDIGGPNVLTYRAMLEKTAAVMNKKRCFVGVKLFSPGLSKLWVSKVTSTSHQLVYPLVDSLKHEMVCQIDQQLQLPNYQYVPFEDSLKKGISKQEYGWVRTIIDYNANMNFKWLENVTSIQRIGPKKMMSCSELAKAYFTWLPRFLSPFIKVTESQGVICFLLFSKFELLKLERNDERTMNDRVLYYITGGRLARKATLNGRMEFRKVDASGCFLISLIDFRPSLPWFIYKYTQAKFHLFVMNRFHNFLRK